MASLATIALAVAAFGVTGYLPTAHAAQVSALIWLLRGLGARRVVRFLFTLPFPVAL